MQESAKDSCPVDFHDSFRNNLHMDITYFDGRDWFWIDMPNHTVYGPFLVESDALESAEQTHLIARLNAEEDAAPKRDRRYLARNSRLRKS